MNEYFECQNCGQVVQGFVASQQVRCCDHPDYERCEGPEVNIVEERIYAARQMLDKLESTLSTISKLTRDIEPGLCVDTDIAVLYTVAASLEEAETALADLCAEHNEQQGEAETHFPFEAWDLLGQRPVTVTGWATHPGYYRIAPGVYSKVKHITLAFPPGAHSGIDDR